MPHQFHVEMPDQSVYRLTRLLAKGESNTKTAKSDKASDEYLTYSLSLAPAKASGFNLCPSASAGCIKACLFTSGLAGVFPRSIQPSRIAKSRMFRLHKKEFIDRLIVEIRSAERRATKLGKRLAVRLNVLSDVQWEREAPELFKLFPNVVFYDYTKILPRMLRFIAGNFPTNYHLTFSRSEENETQALDVLRRGGNVAIPFRVQRSGNLPTEWKGYKVTDADKTDLRFLDPVNVVAGLRNKGRGKADYTGFVLNSDGSIPVRPNHVKPFNVLEEIRRSNGE
jgi:hypothetical protein